MKKKIFSVALAAMIVCGLLSGCEKEKIGTAPRNEVMNIEGTEGFVTVICDEKTGVEYLIYSDFYKGGICPRYNADGTLYVSGEN